MANSEYVSVSDSLLRSADALDHDPRGAYNDDYSITEMENLSWREEWNATHADYPNQCVHTLFEQQARKTPQAVAVEFAGKTLTYARLNARANQVAHWLQRENAGPDVLVGLYLEHSLEMLVALLGVLKAGSAYLPLDPHYPQDRLSFMLEDSGAPLLLTQQSLSQNLSIFAGKRLCLDSDWGAVESESTADPLCELDLQNLAYVIYTSGSTGKPKGVMIPHRGLTNYLWWALTAYPTMEGKGSPLHSSIGFDLTVTGLFPALLTGRTVCLLRPEDAIQSLGAALSQSPDFSLVKLTPAHLDLLEHQVPATAASGAARALVVGGETLFGESLSLWRQHAPGVQIVNEYGPTETTVGCCTFSALAGDCPGRGALPIGRPIANTRLYVLDHSLSPVPIGVPGELYIGGDGVSRGYLNRPELTAESFVPDPFSSSSGGRLYRTGDLVKYRPDGNLLFLGRIDHQVKIRGFRIEPGEIESVLREHPAVQEAVVLAREDEPGNKQLTAYVVANVRIEASSLELRRFLHARLPDHMVPAALVWIDRLPLTANGKIDRQALPAPGREHAAVTESLVEPSTPTESWLADAWREQLGIQTIGANDSFFDLGGHSLAAVRIFNRIHQERGKNLSPATLFQAPTIKELAAILDQEDWKPDWKCLVPIRPNSTRPPFYVIHGALAHVLFCEVLARYIPDEIPLFGLQSLGLDGTSEPLTRIEDMAEVYLREIRGVQPQGPYYLGGISGGGLIALEVAQRLYQQGQTVALLAMLDTECPMRSRWFPERSWLFERKLIPWMLSAENRITKMRTGGLRLLLRRKPSASRVERMEMERDALRGTPSKLPSAALTRIVSLNQAAIRAYKPRPYPGKITLFHAAERHPLQFAMTDTRLAWGDLAADGLDVQLVPGNHATMRYEPNVGVLASKLTACLVRAHGVTTTPADLPRTTATVAQGEADPPEKPARSSPPNNVPGLAGYTTGDVSHSSN